MKYQKINKKNVVPENEEALKRFEQAYSASIKTMYWIAGSLENPNFTAFISSIDDSDWTILFSECISDKRFYTHKTSRKDIIQLLTEYKKLGFIAAIEIPEFRNFVYDANGEPTAWTASSKCNHLRYTYAETTQQLLINIEQIAKECFETDLSNAAMG